MPIEGTTLAPVDVVIVIDTSASMADEAKGLSEVAAAAIEAAATSCPSDLRVEWFGLYAVWPKTHFDRRLHDYLMQECQVAKSDLRHRHREDGAPAVEDIAKHFNWRPNVNRAIFYLGDEALKGGGGCQQRSGY